MSPCVVDWKGSCGCTGSSRDVFCSLNNGSISMKDYLEFVLITCILHFSVDMKLLPSEANKSVTSQIQGLFLG